MKVKGSLRTVSLTTHLNLLRNNNNNNNARNGLKLEEQ